MKSFSNLKVRQILVFFSAQSNKIVIGLTTLFSSKKGSMVLDILGSSIGSFLSEAELFSKKNRGFLTEDVKILPGKAHPQYSSACKKC